MASTQEQPSSPSSWCSLSRIARTGDGAAIQTKLDELIRSSDAEDEFMGIEGLTESELAILHDRCQAAAARTRRLLEQTSAEREKRQRDWSKTA
ncbi:low affinity iron permease family protein [Starkeya sp. ORNL1]|uniref:low affinity iron permease family protein n=1 Tax=Starkeya sp. ORNL1 TaxID=2709380 RepID=UPI0032B213BE